jgi:hypothetical protein
VDTTRFTALRTNASRRQPAQGENVLVAVDRHRVGDIVAALTAAGFRPRHDPPLRVIDGQGIVQFTFQPAGTGRAASPSSGRRT